MDQLGNDRNTTTRYLQNVETAMRHISKDAEKRAFLQTTLASLPLPKREGDNERESDLPDKESVHNLDQESEKSKQRLIRWLDLVAALSSSENEVNDTFLTIAYFEAACVLGSNHPRLQIFPIAKVVEKLSNRPITDRNDCLILFTQPESISLRARFGVTDSMSNTRATAALAPKERLALAMVAAAERVIDTDDAELLERYRQLLESAASDSVLRSSPDFKEQYARVLKRQSKLAPSVRP